MRFAGNRLRDVERPADYRNRKLDRSDLLASDVESKYATLWQPSTEQRKARIVGRFIAFVSWNHLSKFVTRLARHPYSIRLDGRSRVEDFDSVFSKKPSSEKSP